MKHILDELIAHRSLTKESARQVLIEIAGGKYNASQVASFLTVYKMRSNTVAEVQGFRDAMLEMWVPGQVDEPVMYV